jgi:hypothetical protein
MQMVHFGSCIVALPAGVDRIALGSRFSSVRQGNLIINLVPQDSPGSLPLLRATLKHHSMACASRDGAASLILLAD